MIDIDELILEAIKEGLADGVSEYLNVIETKLKTNEHYEVKKDDIEDRKHL
jgi:hypothetical protein